MSGISGLSNDAKILNEATQAILDFEKFNNIQNGNMIDDSNDPMNSYQLGNGTPMRLHNNFDLTPIQEDRDRIIIIDQINTTQQEQEVAITSDAQGEGEAQ